MTMLSFALSRGGDITVPKRFAMPYKIPVKRASASTRTRANGVRIDGVPLQHDILCGKDKALNKHPGNVAFRRLIDSYSDAYERLGNGKQAKMKMTADIVHQVGLKLGARFLKPTADGDWEEISVVAARDKVSHALRFAARMRAVNARAKVSRKTTLQPVLECSAEIPTPDLASSVAGKKCKRQGAIKLDPKFFQASPVTLSSSVQMPPPPLTMMDVRPRKPAQRSCSITSVSSLGSLLVCSQHELMDALMNCKDFFDLDGTGNDIPCVVAATPRKPTSSINGALSSLKYAASI